jgi:GTP-binding protein Era
MKFGYIALIGRPNVGKSTLLNCFLGKKLSITSKKPQTTRHRIMGIKTFDDIQLVFLDTPGLHVGEKGALNRYMNRAALKTLTEVDVVLFLVSGTNWTEEDAWALKKIKETNLPTILVVNKIDLIKQREELLPFIEQRKEEYDYKAIVPISALKGDQLDTLQACIIDNLKDEMHYYEPDQFTDRSDRFVAAEIVREKLMRFLGQEVPYNLTVTIDAFEEAKKLIKIAAIIWVEKAGQKAIVIGKGGEMLKRISTQARLDMEEYFEKKVYVQTWVKVKSNWSDDERALNQLGYSDE